MSYSVDPKAYRRIFAVPADVVDRHIKLAGCVQLKTLLWLLRQNGDDWQISDMAAALGAAEPDIKDALQYWAEAGILCDDSEAASVASGKEEKQPAAEQSSLDSAVQKYKPAPAQKPTREEVARRGAESPDIAFLLSESQKKFGRTITQAEAASLVWIHDYDGLPVAVILMMIEYIISDGKGSVRYLEKTAADWAEKEINTVDKAEKHLCMLASRRKSWRKVERAMSIDHRRPSEKEQQAAVRWVEEWGFSQEMLRAAYDQCVDATAKISIPYINKILEKWHSDGITTVEEVKQAAEKAASAKAGKDKKEKSYDIDELERKIAEQYK